MCAFFWHSKRRCQSLGFLDRHKLADWSLRSDETPISRLLQAWGKWNSDMTHVTSTKYGGVQVVYVGVVHLSTGHGTALGCAEEAVKCLQGCFREWNVFLFLCSA